MASHQGTEGGLMRVYYIGVYFDEVKLRGVISQAFKKKKKKKENISVRENRRDGKLHGQTKELEGGHHDQVALNLQKENGGE